MTGFGVGEAMLAATSEVPPCGDKVSVEIRAVNHRFLDVRVRVPSQLPDLANVVESLARFAKLPESERRKVVFTHLNHSNPAALPDTPERRAIDAAGHRVAAEMERIDL